MQGMTSNNSRAEAAPHLGGVCDEALILGPRCVCRCAHPHFWQPLDQQPAGCSRSLLNQNRWNGKETGNRDKERRGRIRTLHSEFQRRTPKFYTGINIHATASRLQIQTLAKWTSGQIARAQPRLRIWIVKLAGQETPNCQQASSPFWFTRKSVRHREHARDYPQSGQIRPAHSSWHQRKR